MTKLGHQQRNSLKTFKTILRQRIADQLGDDAEIFEGFAGKGSLYRSSWSDFHGVAIDKSESSARDAARERPLWSVYAGDTKRALENGFFSFRPFDVYDLDPYGEPWPFVEALFDAPRRWKNETWLVLTDGYWPRINMAKSSKTLFGNTSNMGSISKEAYCDLAQNFVRRMSKKHSMIVAGSISERIDGSTKGVGQHVFLLQKTKRESSGLIALNTWRGYIT